MPTKDTRESFISKAKEKHGNKYTYDKVVYSTSKVPVTVTCPKHGDFSVKPGNHLNKMYGCRQCAKEDASLGQQGFLKRAKEVHGDKFDYSETKYTTSRDTVTIICRVHGPFSQRASSHLQGYGCKKCAGDEITVHMSKDEFLSRANEVHLGKYDYTLVPETINRLYHTKGKFICPEHGVFTQTYHKHLSGQGCRECSYSVSPRNKPLTLDEVILRSREVHGDKYVYLKYEAPLVTYTCKEHGEITQVVHSHFKGIGCFRCSKNVSTQHNKVLSWLSEIDGVIVNDRKVLGGKELDVYIPSHNLAIEINGEYYHTHDKLNDRMYHYRKFKECEERGIRLLQFWGKEIDDKPELVRSMIFNALGSIGKRIYARKCDIRRVESKEYRDFLNDNHLEGNKSSAIRLGLYHDGDLVSVMGFSKHKDGGYELDRFCSLKDTVVVGAFSKLLKQAPKGKIVSYSFNRYSNGDVYRKNGFTFLRENKTSLFYLYQGEIRNRNQFMKYKLRQKLGVDDNDPRTERELAEELGALQIFDAGTRTWILHNT